MINRVKVNSTEVNHEIQLNLIKNQQFVIKKIQDKIQSIETKNRKNQQNVNNKKFDPMEIEIENIINFKLKVTYMTNKLLLTNK